MKKIVISLALALSAVFITVPAQAAPTGIVNTIAKMFVKEYYKQSRHDQKIICRAWDIAPAKMVKAGAKPLIRAGIAPIKAYKGVAKGLYVVCDVSNSWGGVPA